MGIVTLVSGGLDSTLMSVMADEVGATLFPLFIDYGQLGAAKEWAACQRLHARFNLPSVTRLDVSGFGKVIPSGLTDTKLHVKEDAFVPGRNLLFVLAGAAHALRVQASSVALGLIKPATRPFPDQTLEFVQEAESMIETAIGKHIRVLTPLIEFSKRDVLVMACRRGVEGTYSCHAGGDTPCGVCIACVDIMNAKGGK